jgi:Immunity protein Imm1
VSLTPAEIDQLRVATIADLATLREVPDLVDLLRPPLMDSGEPFPTVWWITSQDDDTTHPIMVLGLRGEMGFLNWYDDPDIIQVPLGTEYREGPEQDYFRAGVHHAAVLSPGEEIPAAYVYEAAAQFVATGQRPTCVQWMDQADVPEHRRPPPPQSDSPIYQAMKAAVEADEESM